ncbi:MAG: VTT domain-containing protein [Clostridium sp.]
MDINTLTDYFTQYGMIMIFVMILLEYMNFPGLAAGIIMPLAGICGANSGESFIKVMIVSLIAGLVGSWILYFIGRFFGDLILKEYLPKFPKIEAVVNKNIDEINNRGSIGVVIGKLVPMARTLIAVPAGALKLNFFKYSASAAVGIFIWNLVFIGSGYYFGGTVMNVLASI